jgi:hypothetical protein
MLAPTAPRQLSILSPGKDAFFFFGSTFVVFLVWLAATRFHVNSFYVLAAVAVVANGPHLVSTWTRVYFDRREWKERPLLIVVMPLCIATAVTLIASQLGFTGSRILNSTILYWATWHFVAQNWGLLRIYQRKSGESLDGLALRLEKPVLFATVAFALTHRIHTGPRVLFGTEVFTPPMPAAVPYAILAPLLLATAVLVGLRIKDRRAPHAKAAWVRLGFLGCSAVGFIVPFLFIKTDDTSAFAAAACWHGVQYLGIVRHYHRTTWKGGVHPEAKIVSWLSQPGKVRLLLYVALLLALAGSGYLIIGLGSFLTRGTAWDEYRWASVVWISFTLSHYWLDGVIWKLSRPEIAARVGITAG